MGTNYGENETDWLCEIFVFKNRSKDNLLLSFTENRHNVTDASLYFTTDHDISNGYWNFITIATRLIMPTFSVLGILGNILNFLVLFHR